MLMNVGYAEASKQANYSCYIFHDVDLLPEDDRNIYSCPEQPRHMSAAIDKFNYKLPYYGIFGGVSAFKKDHFKLINGFSNKFFGWGGEDDDLYERTRFHKLKLSRYSMSIARYKMIKHKNEPLNRPNPKRMSLLYSGKKRFATDGLNSLKYELLGFEKRPLYSWIHVKLTE
ncbi:Beta-1,4-N-acetylgalactosaminyltransferase bre-4 [Lamellibrachia satsuma]|nr:Beta-1,4-N-acetylgalactosaminyltransferase bre-4 [Lamellibrachia satsuma]